MSQTPETQLGVHLLETITLGMYSEPLHCVREYIQNAFDSIRAARREACSAPKTVASTSLSTPTRRRSESATTGRA